MMNWVQILAISLQAIEVLTPIIEQILSQQGDATMHIVALNTAQGLASQATTVLRQQSASNLLWGRNQQTG